MPSKKFLTNFVVPFWVVDWVKSAIIRSFSPLHHHLRGGEYGGDGGEEGRSATAEAWMRPQERIPDRKNGAQVKKRS
jgi:hypothetical protein